MCELSFDDYIFILFIMAFYSHICFIDTFYSFDDFIFKYLNHVINIAC